MGELYNVSILQRRRGYEQVMGEAGLEPRFIDTPYWPPEAAATTGAVPR